MHRFAKWRLCEQNKVYRTNYSVNQRKGLWAEDYVIAELLRQGWGLAARRKKLINGEVDLIFRKSQEIKFIEVKYLNNSWNIFERITKEQKRKLIANRVYYSLQFPQWEFSAAVALVSGSNCRFGSAKSTNTNKLNLIHLEE